jgi:hypothetical protein
MSRDDGLYKEQMVTNIDLNKKIENIEEQLEKNRLERKHDYEFKVVLGNRVEHEMK